MKRIFSFIGALFLTAGIANAQPKTAELMSLGMNEYLASKLGEEAVARSNNTYLTMRNAAGTANIDVLKVDAGDDTVLNADSGDLIEFAVASSTLFTINSTGELIGAGTATLGWAIVAGANAACSTTCTTPCVFGVNTAATEADIVACSDTTADECLCAGAS
jgi:hypothetical protein